MIHTKLLQFNKVSATVLGQDRFLRTNTFLLRCCKIHLIQHLRSGDVLAKKCDLICAQLSMTRRILRWSRTAYYIYNLITTYHKKWPQKCKLNRTRYQYEILFYFYLIMTDINDFCYWLCNLGLCNNPKLLEFTKTISPKLYVIEVVGWIINLLLEQQVIKMKLRKDKQQNNIKDRQMKLRLKQIKLNLIKYSLDLPVSYSYINQSFIKQEFIVIIGVCSSFISLYQTFLQAQGGYQ